MFYQKLRMTLAAGLLSIATIPFVANEAAAGFGHKLVDQTGCCTKCPACDHACNFSVDVVDETKTCFEVESKVICIPRVVFPWQKGNCDAVCNNGAKTRRICVLKTKDYKCPKCEYSWSAEKKATCCDTHSGHSHGGHHSIEHAPVEHAPAPPAPMPAEQVAPEAPQPYSLPSPAQASRPTEDAYYSLFETITTR
ncbi:hypothetical protein [Novipirellula rosea]|uniref:Secreted protein n=1 Tax=Novipirellula rosea TaxID=1031540 RepID=A0ABP8MGN4_9BACT